MGKAGCLVSYIDMDWVVVAWHHNNFYQDTYLWTTKSSLNC